MTERWSEKSGRSTGTSRWQGGALLHVMRVPGAMKRGDALPWRWVVSRGDRHRGPTCAQMRGLCASEREAQLAADAALPLVLRAHAAMADGGGR